MFPLHFNLHCQISVWYLKCMIFLICTQWGYLDWFPRVHVCMSEIYHVHDMIPWNCAINIQVFYSLNKNIHMVVKEKSIQMVANDGVILLKKKLGWCVYERKSIYDITSRCHVNFVVISSFTILQLTTCACIIL